MKFENCDLFKRSFTTRGLGYTFNNLREEKLIKENYRAKEFSLNMNKDPSLMKSTRSKHSLTVVIENNAEEVAEYEKTKSTINHKTSMVSVSLHDPKEPADSTLVPLTSIRIPLGQSTTFLISAKARIIDESGMELSEIQRGCRLDDDTETLNVFNVYTRVSCLFECKMQFSMRMCGCTPWNYPVDRKRQVRKLCML